MQDRADLVDGQELAFFALAESTEPAAEHYCKGLLPVSRRSLWIALALSCGVVAGGMVGGLAYCVLYLAAPHVVEFVVWVLRGYF